MPKPGLEVIVGDIVKRILIKRILTKDDKMDSEQKGLRVLGK